jgi:hypothetical protein
LICKLLPPADARRSPGFPGRTSCFRARPRLGADAHQVVVGGFKPCAGNTAAGRSHSARTNGWSWPRPLHPPTAYAPGTAPRITPKGSYTSLTSPEQVWQPPLRPWAGPSEPAAVERPHRACCAVNLGRVEQLSDLVPDGVPCHGREVSASSVCRSSSPRPAPLIDTGPERPRRLLQPPPNGRLRAATDRESGILASHQAGSCSPARWPRQGRGWHVPAPLRCSCHPAGRLPHEQGGGGPEGARPPGSDPVRSCRASSIAGSTSALRTQVYVQIMPRQVKWNQDRRPRGTSGGRRGECAPGCSSTRRL